MRKHVFQNIPGIFLCFAIGAAAWALGKAFPIVGGPVFGILIGILINLIAPTFTSRDYSFKKAVSAGTDGKDTKDGKPILLTNGIRFTSKKLLQLAVILLGFEMNLYNIVKVGQQSLLVIACTLTASFLTAYAVGKRLRVHGKMAVLIGVGTSICGGSAIAATAPVIGAEDEDVTHAISTIFLFNVIAVFIFPAMGHLWGLSDNGFGMWAGTAINDTSSVVAAGASWSATAGNNTALAFATIVKLTRTLMIVPITLALALYTTRKAGRVAPDAKATRAAAQADGTAAQAEKFNFVRIFPWFVIGFLLAALANTFFGIPEAVAHGLVTAGKFLIVMAMTAIGLNTHLQKLIRNGVKPMLLGLCCWFAVAAVSLLVQKGIGMW